MMTMTRLRSILAENMKKTRDLRSLNQEQLAEIAGLSLGAIKQIETKKRWPSSKTLEKIADALGVSVSELFTEDFKPKITIDDVLSLLAKTYGYENPKKLSQE